MKLKSTNPGKDYEINGEVEISTDEEIINKVKAANNVKSTWKEFGILKRIELLKPIVKEFEKRKN